MNRRQSKATPLTMQVETGKIDSYRRNSLKTNVEYGTNKPEGTRFPITRAILWNRSPTGKAQRISFSSQRKVRVYLNEKTLLLAAKHGNAAASFLIGSFVAEADGVFLQIDRFDPGRNIEVQTAQGTAFRRVPTAVIPGDHVITIKFHPGLCRDEESSCLLDENTMQQSIEILKNRCSKKHPVNVPDFFITHACCYYQMDIDEMITDISCDVFTFATDFAATPIGPIPIIPTALAKNLSGPMRLSYVQGSPKFGYLTMDQKRKLLLLLETDPKIESLPLVGVWVSGVEGVSHPFAWACCLKFWRADYIKERVMAPNSSFLFLHYPTSKGHPDFYECNPVSDANGSGRMLDILTCKEQLVLNSKKGVTDSQDDICLDLSPLGQNDLRFEAKVSNLDENLRRYFTDLSTQRGVMMANKGGTEDGDRGFSNGRDKVSEEVPSPRPSPMPFSISAETHPRAPLVPELSLIETQAVTSSARQYNPDNYKEPFSPEMETAQVLQGDNGPAKVSAPQNREKSSKELHDLSHSNVSFDSHIDDVSFESSGSGQRASKASCPVGILVSDHASGGRGEVMGAISPEKISPPRAVGAAGQSLIGAERKGVRRDEGDRGPLEETASRDERADVMSVFAEHERQLLELRDQIRVLLQQKQEEELRANHVLKTSVPPKTDMSTQCSFTESRLETASVGMNTGESLIFNDRGRVGTATCCDCCGKRRGQISSELEQTQQRLVNSVFGSTPGNRAEAASKSSGHLDAAESCSLSDIKDMQLRSLSAHMSASMQSFASDINAVDLPVFDDSHNNEPDSPDDVALGASASMVCQVPDCQNQMSQPDESPHPSDANRMSHHDASIVVEEDDDFYKQMVDDVKGLLNDQLEANGEARTDNRETSDFRDVADFPNSFEIGTSLADSTQYQEVQSDDTLTAISAAENRLVPQEGAIFHPRINYVSLLGNDIGDEANILADEIAMKYLTSNQCRDIKLNVTQKTKSVKFESAVADSPSGTPAGIPRVNMNYVSVNVSCNMSIATRRYMQRYNLLEGQHKRNPQKPIRSGPAAKDVAIATAPSRDEDKENNRDYERILDLQKLKGLPKLS